MNIGQKIKALRNEAELTQATLAKKLQITRPALSHYELGISQVPNDLLPKIAKFFNVTIDYLFDLEN